MYYDYAYEYDYLCLAIPFLLALVLFYVVYWCFFRSYSHRIRNKKLAGKLTSFLKFFAWLLFLGSVGILIAYGRFDNEFLRITLTITCLAFTYYSYLHWIIRIISIVIHIFIITVIETFFLREIILQLACYEIEQCKGGSSFEEMEILKTIKLTNGSILVDGVITYNW